MGRLGQFNADELFVYKADEIESYIAQWRQDIIDHPEDHKA